MAHPAITADPPWLSIQEVSRRSGLSEPTLRYYEKIGLIEAVPRDASSGHRRYSDGTCQTIEALACLRAAGMSIEDMRNYLRYLGDGAPAAARQRALFERHASRVGAEIARLRVQQRYLELKVALWSARERDDQAAESRAVGDIVGMSTELHSSR